MGGQDFFYTQGKPGNWQEPVNLGYPVNSVKDDVYFVSTGGARNILENVLLSSDRAAACCLELFALQKKRPLKQVSGRVVACETGEPLQGASLSIVDAGNQPVFSKVTDASGSYSFTLEDFTALKATATREGYRSGALEVKTPADTEALTLANPAICLSRIPEVGETEVLNNVYYAFNKAYLLDASFASLDKLVAMLNDNPKVTIEIGGHTDSKGADQYNLKLSEARARSVVAYLVGKGIEGSRLVARGYGESVPVAPNTKEDGSDNPQGREQNRRTEFKILGK
jgi:OmpA-OmpF porin, OOP family